MSTETRIFRPRLSSRTTGSKALKLPGNEVFRRLGLVRDGADLVKQIHRGFPVDVVEKLASELHVSQQTVLKITRIAPATLTRRSRSASGLLSSEESDRVYRIAAALCRALQLYEGDVESARRWLNEPAKALAGESPLEHLDTEAGAAEVHDLIGRLEHGVYT